MSDTSNSHSSIAAFIEINTLRIKSKRKRKTFKNGVLTQLHKQCKRKKNTKMSSKDEQPKHNDKELDLSNAGRGVWLVKVPKYLANKWEKVPGSTEVGKLRITKQQGQKAQVSLSLNENLTNIDPEEPIPKEHFLDVSVVTKQTLGVFSHTLRKY